MRLVLYRLETALQAGLKKSMTLGSAFVLMHNEITVLITALALLGLGLGEILKISVYGGNTALLLNEAFGILYLVAEKRVGDIKALTGGNE